MTSLRSLVSFGFSNFGPLLVFYASNHFWGLKAGIATSLLFTAFEVLAHIKTARRLTTLFKFSAIMTFCFGALDLYLQQSLFFRYEASVSNLFTAFFFGVSLFSEKTVIQEFTENRPMVQLQSQPQTQSMTEDRVAYLRLLTGIWSIYFLAKAFLYFIIARRFGLEQGLLIRTLVGSSSFYALLFASIWGSRWIFPALKRLGWLPVPRTVSPSFPA